MKIFHFKTETMNHSSTGRKCPVPARGSALDTTGMSSKWSLSLTSEKASTGISSLSASQPGQLLAPSPPLDGIFITGIKLSNKV